jgi:hypothetical protein
MRRPTLAFLVLVLLACGGCMGGGDAEAEIKKADLRRLVLQPGDLPRVFRQFDFGELGNSDVRPGPREDPRRFGREAGWKARYSRSGSAETSGPLVIESIADVFSDEDGAEQDLEAYRTELEERVNRISETGRSLAPPDLGDEAVLVTATQGPRQRAIRVYALAWRQANATFSLVVNGFEGRLSAAHALRLARKQEQRIDAALQ